MSDAKYQVTYRKTVIWVPEDPRTGICQACGYKGKTDLHHIFYKYATKFVRKSPKLALENTVELCFPCHRIANAIQLLAKDYMKTNILRRILQVTA